MSREIRLAKKILESAGYEVKPSTDYEDYTETQIEEELNAIESSVEEIIDELRETPEEYREDLQDKLEDLTSKLYDLEEYVPEGMKEKVEDIKKMIFSAEDISGPDTRRDPYADRGLNRADFY